MTRIPSFLFGSALPADADLQDSIAAGIIPRSVTVFSGKAAYERGTGYLAPTNGTPQWWAQVSGNPGIGYFRLTGRTHKAGAMSLNENRMYSSQARAFYAEHSELLVPEVELVLGQGWGSLSFARSANPPAEYPLGEVRMWGDNAETHYFPTDCVLFMVDGQPYFERITQAIERFKLTPQMPIGPGSANTGGYTADQVVAAALSVADFSTAPEARAILNSNESNVAKAGKLVAL